MNDPGKFVPPEGGGFGPPEEGGFVPDFLQEPSGPAPAGGSAPLAGPPRRKVSRRNTDQLGIVWLRGTLHIGVRRQRKTLGVWSSPAPVQTADEFAAALDRALAELKFEGTDTFLVYEGEHFLHQPESAPGFSAAATRHYLQSRIARYVQERGPVLWAIQPTVPLKDEKAFLLHLMPQEFYLQLRRIFPARRLDLTRILPMVVAVQREMSGFPLPKGAPVLVAAEVADATFIVVAQAGGPLLFCRTILASLEQAPERVAVEINRSLLFAKQQYNASVDRIWLVTRTGRAQEEVVAKCGAGKMVLVLPTQPEEWVTSAARVPRTQPINLVANYLRRKRRDQFIRLGLIAAGWLLLANFGQTLWNAEGAWRGERARLAALDARLPQLIEERDQVAGRNTALARQRELSDWAGAAVLPPVPPAVLAHLAAILPADARLTECSVRWDEKENRWLLQCEGLVYGDEESAREVAAALQRQLSRGPLRVRFGDAPAGLPRTTFGGPAAVASQQRFTLEGILFED